MKMILNTRKSRLMATAFHACALTGATISTGWLDSARAQDALESLKPMTVVGSMEEAFDLPGSASYQDVEQFRARGYTNIAQIAARVPGVYVRDEDGYGNFPNISLRGVDGSRSTKVTIMEDGILTSPAPYSAPNAYYAPKAARMSGIEFLKGSSQIKYGPQTTGGVVNYLSTMFPEESGPSFYSRLTYGSYNTMFLHSWYGDSQQTKAGKIGYLFELHGESSDGYRDIDGSSQDAGFSLIEPMLKVFWEPDTALKQRLELKIGYTNFDANESYTGLADADLRADPDRRYAATFHDAFDSEQWRTYLKWIAEPSDALRLESALYFNSFDRSWDKLASVDLTATGSTITNVAEAMRTADGLALLQGLGPGNLGYADAYRTHDAFGWQNQANFRFDTGSWQHNLALGLRLHYDQQDGDTVNTTYASNGIGGFGQTAVAAAVPITQQEAFATAIYIEDSITIDKLTLRPGLRYEWLELESSPFGAAAVSVDEALLMAGMGANYEFTEIQSIFGGIYRGMSPANPSGYAAGTDSEESLGFELGLRHQQEALRAELVGFFTDFDNLIAPELPGGAGTLPSQNGGSAEVWGIESLVEYDHGQSADWGFGLPVYASLTYTNARFANMSAPLANSGVFGGGRNGNDIPYIPEWRLASGVSLVMEKWRVNLDASYVSTTWGTGYNDDVRAGNPSTMDGKIDSLLIFDLTGHYQLTDNVRLVGGIQNLFDERGIISRAPLGARANAPQTVFAGFEAAF